MTDLFGYAPPEAPFIDIRNTRASVAEEKAVLCQRLNEILRKTPKCLASASVQVTRQWQASHKAAKKTLESTHSSVQQLHSAINAMERFQ